MTELKTFEFMPGLNLRTLTIKGEPWFVAEDVCDAVALRPDNIHLKVQEDEIKSLQNSGLRGSAPLIVSESGLYALALKSRKPEAKAFRKWVTTVVLPAIREDDGEIRQAEDEIVQTAWHILHRRVQERTARGRGTDTGTETA